MQVWKGGEKKSLAAAETCSCLFHLANKKWPIFLPMSLQAKAKVQSRGVTLVFAGEPRPLVRFCLFFIVACSRLKHWRKQVTLFTSLQQAKWSVLDHKCPVASAALVNKSTAWNSAIFQSSRDASFPITRASVAHLKSELSS